MKTWKQLCLSMTLVMVLALMLPLNVLAGGLPEDLYFGREALAELDNAEALLYAYDAIAEGIANAETHIDIADGVHRLSKDEAILVYETYSHDHTEAFWLPNRYAMGFVSTEDIRYLALEYNMTGDALEAAKAAFDAAAEEILSGIDEDMTEFEKELHIHDALADRIVYAESGNAHNAYGALVEGVAVCEGYAEAFQALLHRVGIRSFIVTGESRAQAHGWNIVRIDGEWYHVDLTWDDQGDTLFHAYFNITDAEIREDHAVYETSYALPACTSAAANYFTHEGTRVTEYDRAQAAVLLLANRMTLNVYVDGDVDSYLDSLTQDLGNLISQLGLTGRLQMACSYMGHEIILQIIVTPDGVSAEIEQVSGDRLTVTVRGGFDEETTADLYLAVYDAVGRMIGIAKADGQVLSGIGTSYQVAFDGAAAQVKVFASGDGVTPMGDAIEMEIE